MLSLVFLSASLSILAASQQIVGLQLLFGPDTPLNALVSEDTWWRCCGPPTSTAANLTHPHMGARHPNGSLGMVVDPTVKRLRKPPSPRAMIANDSNRSILCPKGGQRYGIEGEGGNAVLHKIRRGLKKAQTELRARNATEGQGGGSVRILCMIYTVYTEADIHSAQTAIAETWGQQCDGFIGASNLTDHSIGTIDLPHQGPEEYGNMWQKIRSMWTYAYDHFRNDYDYFYIAGDDTYVLMDHLRLFLKSAQVQRLQDGHLDRISRYYAKAGAGQTATLRPRPLLLGQPMMFKRMPVIAGGSGYVFNQAALEMWGRLGADNFRVDVHDSREDIFMAEFFVEHHVYITDTQDDEGGWRFRVSAQATSEFQGRNSPISPTRLKRMFNFTNKVGIHHVSEHQISFHLKTCKKRLATSHLTVTDLMYRYHAFFNSWCANDNDDKETVANAGTQVV